MDKKRRDVLRPEVIAKAKANIEARKKLKTAYSQLFEAISSLLFQHDPIKINFETNTDEYDSETGTIIPRLNQCSSEADVLKVVYEGFCRWFDPDVAGPKSNYEKISAEIWKIWIKSRGSGHHTD